jgi:threonine/homoserine/homoserine lactone efflux protein
MEFTYFLKGLIVGFSLPIPIGPVGILCIRRTLATGKLHGFLTGLSAAVSDMTYSIIAAFGITLVSDFISEHQQWIRLVGGAVLLMLGYRTFRSNSVKEASTKPVIGPALVFFSTFLVTFTNPMALFAYAAAFATIGTENLARDRQAAALLVAGVFLGSLSWFSLLTSLSRIFKERITVQGLALVNKVAGVLFMLFGMIILWSGLYGI